MPLTIDPASVLKPESRVTAVSFSADGKYIAWGEEGGELTICDIDGENRSDSKTIEGGISKLEFAPDGTTQENYMVMKGLVAIDGAIVLGVVVTI
jgi:WD40 repeat protein